VNDTLGLLEEARQLAIDLGYRLRDEPLGELPGGLCVVGGARHLLLNLEQTPADRLAVLLQALVSDPRVASEPKSRLLAKRLAAVSDRDRAS
jgi:hypothetical protein